MTLWSSTRNGPEGGIDPVLQYGQNNSFHGIIARQAGQYRCVVLYIFGFGFTLRQAATINPPTPKRTGNQPDRKTQNRIPPPMLRNQRTIVAETTQTAKISPNNRILMPPIS